MRKLSYNQSILYSSDILNFDSVKKVELFGSFQQKMSKGVHVRNALNTIGCPSYGLIL